MKEPVVWIFLFLYGTNIAFAITVSPDVGLRNQSSAHDITAPPVKINSRIPIEKSERFRRLIPYMTFYVPSNFPITDYYNLNPIQQQRMAAALQATNGNAGPPSPPHGYQDTNPVQVTRLQPSSPNMAGAGTSKHRPPLSFNLKFPSSRPNFQIIAYNTRHQSAQPQAMPLHRDSPIQHTHLKAIHQSHHEQDLDHILTPLSFKHSNMNMPYRAFQKGSKQHKHVINPFTNENKLPGSFRPIIYADPEQVFTPQGEQTEQLPEQPKEQGQIQTGIDGPTSTVRTIYYSEAPQKQDLTPQQKYVAYLQQQVAYQNLRLKQHLQQTYQEVITPSTASPDTESKLSEKLPSTTTSSVLYTQTSTPTSSLDENYNQIPEQTVHSPKPGQGHQPVRVSTVTRPPNYLEYLQPNQQHIINIPNLVPSNQPYNSYNSLVYYTTPNPSYIPSRNPIYRTPVIEPLYEPDPVFKVPVKKPPPPIRQHHTETISFAPAVSTYNPNIEHVTTPRPKYNSYATLSRTEKHKQAQRHRPPPPPTAVESNDLNVEHHPDELPQSRPIYAENPEKRPDQVYIQQQEQVNQNAGFRPDSQFSQQPQVFPGLDYAPDLVLIPRPKPRPKPTPKTTLKVQLRPQHEFHYESAIRPSPSYYNLPENKPSYIPKQNFHQQAELRPQTYQELEYHTDSITQPEPRPNFEVVPDSETTLGQSNHSVWSQQPEYEHTGPGVSQQSQADSTETAKPDLITEANLKEHPDAFLLNHKTLVRPVSPGPPIKPSLVYTPRPELSRPASVYKEQSDKGLASNIKPDSQSEQSHAVVSSPAKITGQDISQHIEDDLNDSSLAEILRKLQDSNQLPKTLTPDNIDDSIRTLIKILNNLKQTQTIAPEPIPEHHEEEKEYHQDIELVQPAKKKKPGPGSGRPGIDYPTLDEIPKTAFNCKEQRYKGFFGDPDTGCQVWHYCDLNGGQASFLCPNGTIFSQVALTCDWWFNVKCSTTAQLYVLNERLYKYILPFTPKFPEDYSGPLVDKYLALKFKEMEEKMRRERNKGKSKDDTESKMTAASVNGTESVETESEESSEEEDNDDELGGKSSFDTGLVTYSTTITPSSTTEITSNAIGSISVPSTPASYQPPSTTTTYAAIAPPDKQDTDESKITVESEKAEVIEINSHGSSGHLSHSYVAQS